MNKPSSEAQPARVRCGRPGDPAQPGASTLVLSSCGRRDSHSSMTAQIGLVCGLGLWSGGVPL